VTYTHYLLLADMRASSTTEEMPNAEKKKIRFQVLFLIPMNF